MEIMGQILRNKYGSLSRDRLKEIVGTIADAGLRLISAITSKEGIVRFEDFLVERIRQLGGEGQDVNPEVVRKAFRGLIVGLIYNLIRRISGAIGRKELEGVVDEVVRERETTAYDVIGAFFGLGVADEVDRQLVDSLARLLKGCKRRKNRIASRLISWDVQRYLSTHWVNERLRRRLFGALELVYRPNVGGKRRGTG